MCLITKGMFPNTVRNVEGKIVLAMPFIGFLTYFHFLSHSPGYDFITAFLYCTGGAKVAH